MKVIEINDEKLDEVIKSDKKVVLDCYASWCGPCKMMAPIIDELANEFKDIKFYKINVDENDGVSMKYDILSIPTILLFENGKLKNKFIGFRPKDEFRDLIRKWESYV